MCRISVGSHILISVCMENNYKPLMSLKYFGVISKDGSGETEVESGVIEEKRMGVAL